MKKRMKRKTTKLCKNKTRKSVYLGISGIVLIVVALVLAINLKFNDSLAPSTGASISIEYYGLSKSPMKTQVGKLQTYIYLTQPALGEMGELENKTKRLEVAKDIVETADFPYGIQELYQNNPPADRLPFFALTNVLTAAAKENDNFKKNLFCLERLGFVYGHQSYLGTYLVSELKYQRCVAQPDWLFAYMKHTFWNKEGDGFLCDQENERLFLVEEKTGEISLNTTGC